jgi:hypothetical protein
MLLQMPSVWVNATDSGGSTALATAVIAGNIRIATLLLQHPTIGPNITTAEHRDTPLHLVGHCPSTAAHLLIHGSTSFCSCVIMHA